jgi:acylphosphatase
MSEAETRPGRPRCGGRVGAVEVLVEGHVQGVGYRNFAQRRALDRGLTGYAMNLPDGRVRVRAEGDVEQIEQFVRDLEQGPPLAHVTRVAVTAVPFTGRFRDFGIRFTGER